MLAVSYGNCRRCFVPMQDPMLDFDTETVVVPARPVATSSFRPLTRTPTPAPNHAIDATSRVVSFVLGFALASVFAWLGSIPSEEPVSEGRTFAAASTVEPVAPAAQPVVPAAIVEAPVIPDPAPPVKTVAPPVKAVAPRTAPAATPSAASQQRRPAVSGYRGALVLSSSPEGAQVLINGRVAGQTPIVLDDLPAGSRAVVLRRDGYAPWSASVRVVANERIPIRATLKPLDQ